MRNITVVAELASERRMFALFLCSIGARAIANIAAEAEGASVAASFERPGAAGKQREHRRRVALCFGRVRFFGCAALFEPRPRNVAG